MRRPLGLLRFPTGRPCEVCSYHRLIELMDVVVPLVPWERQSHGTSRGINYGINYPMGRRMSLLFS